MPKTPMMLLTLIGLSAGLLGCDSQASQQAEAQRHLDAALAKLGRANAGYVEHENEQSPYDGPMLVYRQEAMDAAFEDLNKVMSLDAPIQKMQALRLGAEIDASAARHAAREAAVENAALAGRTTVLLGYLSAMEGASARSAALQPQTDEQLAKLQAEIQTQSAKRDQLTAAVDDLDAQLRAVTAEVEQFQARADEGYAQAQALREQAFVFSGDRMYDLQDKAADLERGAAVESANAEQRQVLVNDLTAKLALDRVQLDTVNKLLAELEGQVKRTRADTQRLADESNAASQASGLAARTLADEYTQIMDVYAEAIEKRMKLAGEKADKAIEALKQAQQVRSDPAEAQSLKLQMLSAYVDQAHIATSHASYVRDLAGTTESLLKSVSRITPGDAEKYRAQLGALTDAEVALKDKASAAIETGLTLAQELAPAAAEDPGVEPSEAEAIALKQLERLSVYKAERL